MKSDNCNISSEDCFDFDNDKYDKCDKCYQKNANVIKFYVNQINVVVMNIYIVENKCKDKNKCCEKNKYYDNNHNTKHKS